jgi:Glycosyl transferases group 1
VKKCRKPPVYVIGGGHFSADNSDGVNLAQREVNTLLADRPLTYSNSLINLLRKPKTVTSLLKGSTVYCNLDPYAYVLMALRENWGCDYRVIRNVQTGPWSGYLLQEWLCRALERPDDVTLYTSEYVRASYSAYFVRQSPGKHIVGYPNTLSACKQTPMSKNRHFECGFFGRLARDKNFTDALACFAAVLRKRPLSKFAIVGAPHDMDFTEEQVSSLISGFGLKDRVEYFGLLPHNATMDTMSRTRTVVFPSTSNVESFGRVVAEAHLRGCNIAASNHGAMPEFIPSENLAEVDYYNIMEAPTLRHFPTGTTSANELASLALDSGCRVNKDHFAAMLRHKYTFLDALDGNIDGSYSDLIGNVEPFGQVSNIPEITSAYALSKANILVDSMKALFLPDCHLHSILEELVNKSLNKKRTQRFINTIKQGNLDIRDIGGWPIEACSVLQFDPRLSVLKQSFRENFSTKECNCYA